VRLCLCFCRVHCSGSFADCWSLVSPFFRPRFSSCFNFAAVVGDFFSLLCVDVKRFHVSLADILKRKWVALEIFFRRTARRIVDLSGGRGQATEDGVDEGVCRDSVSERDGGPLCW
jgi:hypothetical protein